MQELLRKDFELDVLWKTFKYKQLTFQECLDFDFEMRKKDFDVSKWAYNLLKHTISKKEFYTINLQKFLDVYLDTAMRGFYSKKTSKWWKEAPTSSFIVWVCKYLKITPKEYLEYTPEAINYLVEGMIWNLNEQTKEWQRKNKISLMSKDTKEWNKDEDLEAVLEMRKKKALKNNKQ